MESASQMGDSLIVESVDVFTGSSFSFGFPAGLSQVECAHFWLIDSPNGPTSAGVCKICGEAREFRNSIYSSTWSKGMVKGRTGWEAV